MPGVEQFMIWLFIGMFVCSTLVGLIQHLMKPKPKPKIDYDEDDDSLEVKEPEYKYENKNQIKPLSYQEKYPTIKPITKMDKAKNDGKGITFWD